VVTTATAEAAAGAVAPAPSPRGGEGLRRWGRRGRSWLPLVVLSGALGLGLYGAAAQAGWLAVGWRPALATTLLYLAGVTATLGGLAGVTTGMEALARRGLGRDLPGPWVEARPSAPPPVPVPGAGPVAAAGLAPAPVEAPGRAG
jgi:hypothetical protein